MFETITFEGHTFNRATCPECGNKYSWTPGKSTRVDAVVRHMIEAGELTLGEARAEMRGGLVSRDTQAYIAEWSLWAHDLDLPDTYRRGDTLPV